MTAATPAPRNPGRAASRTEVSPAGDGAPARRSRRGSGRIRWRRLPGRIILALCFALGALALGAVVIPFTTTTEGGTELRCGPAVFEVLMPTDPAFDDTPENVGCAEPARTRLLVAGGVLVGVVLVAAIAERRTRRGSVQRDTAWLSSSRSSAAGRRPPARTSTALPGSATGSGSGSKAISSGSRRNPSTTR